METCKGLSLAGLVLGAADDRVGNDLCAGLKGCGRELDQCIGNVVGSGDGLAVAEHQALVDLNGEGLGAVFICNTLDAAADSVIDDVLAALVGGDGGVVVDQVADHLVGCVVGPPCTGANIAGDFRGAAVDEAVGTCLSRSSRLLDRSCGLSRGGSGLAAGAQCEDHCYCKKHCKKLLHCFSS